MGSEQPVAGYSTAPLPEVDFQKSASQSQTLEIPIGTENQDEAQTENETRVAWHDATSPGSTYEVEPILGLGGEQATKGDNFSIPSKSELAQFQIIRCIGHGGSSRVAQVQHISTGKIAAVKVVRKTYLLERDRGKQRRERLINERRLCLQLQHPFIVHTHCAFQTMTHVFFMMDFCIGGELFNHLCKRGRFEECDAMFYFCEIFLALEHIHSHRILYRDLSLENCLLDDEGHVRLTDFGLSKPLGDSSIARSTSFVGNTSYLSPEILTRRGHSFPNDYYQLGVVLYMLLDGGIPHYQGDHKQMFASRVKGEAIRMPPCIVKDSGCWLILLALLTHEEENRAGASEIRGSKWLELVDWALVLSKNPQPCFPHFPPIDPNPNCSFDQFVGIPMPPDLSRFRTGDEQLAGHAPLDDFAEVASP